ncbi:Uncharacterised protein [Mycobacteroides abscessus subsp. abscessus]|nr:Uncharacterised protein [Mycobacteroides abscessus subsp. abscessus]
MLSQRRGGRVGLDRLVQHEIRAQFTACLTHVVLAEEKRDVLLVDQIASSIPRFGIHRAASPVLHALVAGHLRLGHQGIARLDGPVELEELLAVHHTRNQLVRHDTHGGTDEGLEDGHDREDRSRHLSLTVLFDRVVGGFGVGDQAVLVDLDGLLGAPLIQAVVVEGVLGISHYLPAPFSDWPACKR